MASSGPGRVPHENRVGVLTCEGRFDGRSSSAAKKADAALKIPYQLGVKITTTSIGHIARCIRPARSRSYPSPRTWTNSGSGAVIASGAILHEYTRVA
jgi:hypothetical protein